MNKKIYYQSNFLLIANEANQPSGNQIIVNCNNNAESIVLEKTREFLQQTDRFDLILLSNDVDSTFRLIKNLFHYIEAAGGLIEHNKQFVLIYRLGKWDLPKGKIGPGENPVQAAIRECEEECKVRDLQIIRELPPSFHIYPYKDKLALKKTYWFAMNLTVMQTLIPQTEEYIEKSEWMNTEQIIKTVLPNTYPAISDVLMGGIFNK